MIALAPEFNRGFISCGKADVVVVFDLKTLKVLGQVKTGANPDAILYDATFAQVGTHGAGPHWTSVDGSTVNGVKLQQDSTYEDAIPWLLLQASSTSGIGVFTDITYVQRLNTAGGTAPATGCNATTVNTDTRVSYSADYYFYTSGASDGGATGQ